MGREICGTGRERPVRRFKFSTKKPLYLKTPSIPKSNSSEAASASFIRRLCPLRRKYSIHLAQV